MVRKGSLTGKAVVPKTTAHLSLAGSSPVPSAKRISDFGMRISDFVNRVLALSPHYTNPKSEIANPKSFGPVAQWNESATLRRSRSHVQIVPGPPRADTENE